MNPRTNRAVAGRAGAKGGSRAPPGTLRHGSSGLVFHRHGKGTLESVRFHIFAFVEGSVFKGFITAVIALNTGLVIFETDNGAACEDAPGADSSSSACASASNFAGIANQVFLVIYAIEMVLRMYVLRLDYFRSAMDVFDAVIVSVGVIGQILGGVLPGIGVFRLLRVARATRALRLSAACDEVRVFISGIPNTIRAIAVGAVLIAFFLMLWAIAAVALVNPLNQKIALSGLYDEMGCQRCKVAYESVAQSMLTLLQTIIMGDAWGIYSVPIIEHHPWTAVIFVGASFCMTFGLTNLILAVIIDKALENREVNLKKEADKHQAILEDARREFVFLCSDIDADGSGFISLEELVQGFEHDSAFHMVLSLLDIEKTDLETVFRMMDKEKTGEVSYEDFAYELQSLKSRDTRTIISFIKYYVHETHSLTTRLHERLDVQEGKTHSLHTRLHEHLDVHSVHTKPRHQQLSHVTNPQQPNGSEWNAKGDTVPLTCEPLASADLAQTGAIVGVTSRPPLDAGKDHKAETGDVLSDVVRRQLQELRLGLERQASRLRDDILLQAETCEAVLLAAALSPPSPNICEARLSPQMSAAGARAPESSRLQSLAEPSLTGEPEEDSQGQRARLRSGAPAPASACPSASSVIELRVEPKLELKQPGVAVDARMQRSL